ncbi:MAG: hypothetical protein ACHP78_09035 [Terriglobales bacterium]
MEMAIGVADATVLPKLLHGKETRVWGGQGYAGQTEVRQRAEYTEGNKSASEQLGSDERGSEVWRDREFRELQCIH